MSHITQIDLKIESLEALQRAAEERGCELDMSVKNFTAYYTQGTECDGVVRVKGKSDAYTVGVVKQTDGTYKLAMDNYQGARGLVAKVGTDALQLRRSYSACFAEDHWRRKRCTVQRRITTDGIIQIVAEQRRY